MIAYEGRWLGGETFVSFDKKAVTLLAAQGATFADVVSAVAYLKRPDDAAEVRSMLSDRGFDGFPCAFVDAPLCRPELLCEIEAVAVLPRAGSAG